MEMEKENNGCYNLKVGIFYVFFVILDILILEKMWESDVVVVIDDDYFDLSIWFNIDNSFFEDL